MKFPKIAALAATAALAVSAPALAQDAGLAAGAVVYGPEGNEVGTIEKLEGGNVVLNTGTHTATLASNAFAAGENGPVMALTKAQLNAAIEQSMTKQDAALDAQLVAGTALTSKDGVPMGTVKSVSDAGMVTVTRGDGSPFALDKGMFMVREGGLVLLMTEAELEAALSGEAPAAENAATAAEAAD